MARKLKLQPGDSVSFVVQTPQGAVNSTDAVVCGVFRKGAPWHDNAFYLPLASAQALFDWPGDATAVRVMLKSSDASALDRARTALEDVVRRHAPPAVEGTRVRVESHRQAGRFFFSIVQANQTALVVNPGVARLAFFVTSVNVPSRLLR